MLQMPTSPMQGSTFELIAVRAGETVSRDRLSACVPGLACRCRGQALRQNCGYCPEQHAAGMQGPKLVTRWLQPKGLRCTR